MLRCTIILSGVLAVAACAPDYSPNTYAAGAVQQASKVDRGIVIGVREVDVSARGTTGAVVGGAAGGIAGSQAPGGPVAGAFGALGGSVVGGLVGVSVEHAAGDTKAYEYIVRKPNGDLVSVTQKDESPLSVGRHVLVIAGAQARIVPDYTVIADPDAGKTPPKPDAPAAAKADAPPKVAADAVMPPALPAITQPGVSTLLEPLKSGVVPDLP